MTPPGTPLFPSLEMESNRANMIEIGTPNARPTALKSRVSAIMVFLLVFIKIIA